MAKTVRDNRMLQDLIREEYGKNIDAIEFEFFRAMAERPDSRKGIFRR